MIAKAFVAIACILVAFALGAALPPAAKEESNVRVDLDSLRQCHIDLAQLTEWKADRNAKLIAEATVLTAAGMERAFAADDLKRKESDR